MTTNLYGIILWQMQTYLVNEKQEIHMIPSVRSTGGGSQGDRWYPASCWALPKEIIFNLFNISAFASWIAFVGII